MSRYSGGRPEAGEGLHRPGAGVTGSGFDMAVSRWDSTAVSGGRVFFSVPQTRQIC